MYILFDIPVDEKSLSLIEQFPYAIMVTVLVGALFWLGIAYKDERKKNHELAIKSITALGANNEIIRNNTDVLNQVKAKLNP